MTCKIAVRKKKLYPNSEIGKVIPTGFFQILAERRRTDDPYRAKKVSKEEIAEMIFSKAKVIIKETNLMGKFINQLVSKLPKLDGFIQHFTSNLVALDLEMEDIFILNPLN